MIAVWHDLLRLREREVKRERALTRTHILRSIDLFYPWGHDGSGSDGGGGDGGGGSACFSIVCPRRPLPAFVAGLSL